MAGVTVSIGLATASAEDADVDELLLNADAALYRAKARARSSVRDP